MRYAICNELFEGWEFSRVCRFVQSVGYQGLELAPFTLAPTITDLSSSARSRLRAQAADAGVDIIGLHWLLAGTTGLHLTSPDRDVRQRTTDYLIALTDACHDLGGTLMVFGSPKQRSRHPGLSLDHAFDLAAETLLPVLPALARHGITLCMEPLSSAETDFVNTCDDALRLCRRLNHPQFVLHLDVKAMASEPTPILDLIREHAGRAGHFHANDPNLRGPGFGSLDFVPIFRALEAAGYDKWVSVEVFDYTPDPETVARQSIDYMTQCRLQEKTL